MTLGPFEEIPAKIGNKQRNVYVSDINTMREVLAEHDAAVTATEAAVTRGIPETAGSDRQRVKIIDGVPTWQTDTRFDARDFGTWGAGDDLAAMQAAVDAAEALAASVGTRQNVYLAPRVWDIPGTTPLTVDSSRVHLISDGLGAVISAPDIGSGNAIVEFTGAISSAVTTLTANVTEGDVTVTVASAAGLAVGDMLVLRSDETFNPDRAYYTKGEFADIAGISGVTITLAAPVRDSYDNTTDTVSVDVVTPLVDVGMTNVTVMGGGVDGRYGIRAQYCSGMVFDRVRSIDNPYSGVEVEVCRDVRFDRCYAEGSDQAGLGYGLRAHSAERVVFDLCEGYRNRHTVDADQLTGGPVARDITYRTVTARNDTAPGISTHGGTDHVTMRDCRTFNCGGGIVSRGRNTSILDCEVNGVFTGGESSKHGIYIGDGPAHPIGDGLAGTGLLIRGCRVNVRGDRTASTDVRGIDIFAPLVNARITDNDIEGFGTFGLYTHDVIVRDTTIARNTIDCRNSLVGTFYCGIWIAATTPADGLNQINLTIEQNRIIDCPGRAIRVDGNGATGANASTGVRILKNNVGTFGDVGIDLRDGSFRDVEIDLGAPTTWTNQVYTVTAPTIFIVRAIGTGTPEGVVVGGIGSEYKRADGAASTTLYIKTSGSGNTGWTAK